MTETLLRVFETLLDWPFLAFLLVLIAFWLFRSAIANAIGRGGIAVTWGGNRVAIGEVVEQIDDELKQSLEDFKTTMDEVRALRAEVDALKQALPEAEKTAFSAQAAAPRTDASLWPKMKRALADTKYRWRTLERLAITAGITEQEAHRILADHDDEVVLGSNAAGKVIARLKDR